MIPRATYRLQFHKDFPFAAALPLASYLRELGVSHLYCSPILKARAGSPHGYDVIDPCEIDPEVGGEEGFRMLVAELRARGLGVILDIVPNHMAVDGGNRWWMDVLEHGRGSCFANYFDIDWEALDGKVLTAFLGDPYWETLAAGKIRIVRDGGRLSARYFDRCLPLRREDQSIDPSNVRTPDALHTLLERQHWRLAWWRTANDTINWRRFFDVPDLIALNQDSDEVFEATHAKIFDLYGEGLIDGVRVDHVDGLANPAHYCRRLRRRLADLAKLRPEPDPHPYIVVEKILGAGEMLPADWDVEGTTGYDFMNGVSALEHDPRGAEPLGRLWHDISHRSPNFDDEERLARGEIARGSFESALSRTTDSFFSLAQGCKAGRDVTHAALRRALIQILQSLRVYRTYATGEGASDSPGAPFVRAVSDAEFLAGGVDHAAIALVASVMGGNVGDLLQNTTDAVRRFNLLSAPVAAKAVEDTALYRYGRLLSRNDVGFDPGTFARSPASFHAAMRDRAHRFPHALLATATHDHKQGEDVRARLAVLSESPEEWEERIQRWMVMNVTHRMPFHDAGAEYQLYQALVGAWPLWLRPDDLADLQAFRDRILAWRKKALREAKLRTSWLDPNEAYENADAAFIHAILNPRTSPAFLDDLADFVRRIAPGAALNGLVQSALRCTAPGVPDCYQGTEFWDFSLVDPDNRRPVDYAARVAALGEQSPAIQLLDKWHDGRVKQTLIATILNFRRDCPQVFLEGGYLSLEADGKRAGNVLAFARPAGNSCIIVAVPLRCGTQCTKSPLLPAEFWADTVIDLTRTLHRSWTHLFDEQFKSDSPELLCRDLFARFPVAILK